MTREFSNSQDERPLEKQRLADIHIMLTVVACGVCVPAVIHGIELDCVGADLYPPTLTPRVPVHMMRKKNKLKIITR
eukprot:6220122-Amphidinium_carterae.1